MVFHRWALVPSATRRAQYRAESDNLHGGREKVEAGRRITDWAEREPELFIGRRDTDACRGGDGRQGERRRAERRQGERRSSGAGDPWLAMGLPDRRAAC